MWCDVMCCNVYNMCASRCKYIWRKESSQWQRLDKYTKEWVSEEILLWGIYLCSPATHHLSTTSSSWQHSSLSSFFCELLVVEIPDLRSFFSELFCEPILLSAQHVYAVYTPRAVLQCVEPQVVGIPQGLSPHPQQSLEQPCRTIVKKIEKGETYPLRSQFNPCSNLQWNSGHGGRAISWTIFCAAIAMQQAPIAVPHSAAAPTNRRVPLLSWTLPHTRGTHGPSVSNPGSHKTCNNDSSIALDCFHPPTAATFHKSTDNLWIWLAN